MQFEPDSFRNMGIVEIFPPRMKRNASHDGDRRIRFSAVRLCDIEITSTPPALVEDILFPNSLVVVYGESGCGKSFIVSHMAMHVAAGWTWAGKVTTSGTVVYVTAEGAVGFRKRMVAFRQELKPPASTPFYVISDAPDLGHEEGDAETLIARIREQVGDKIALVVIDTLARTIFGADENSARDVSVVVSNVAKIISALGASVVLVHHSGKNASQGARGSSALKAAADTEILIEKTEAGGFATVTKAKDAEGGLTMAFGLMPVEIAGTEAETSCIVSIQTWQTAATSKPIKLSSQMRIALRALEEAISERGEIPPASTQLNRTKRVVREPLWREACRRLQITETDKPDTKNKAFKRAAEKLQSANIIGFYDGWVWIN